MIKNFMWPLILLVTYLIAGFAFNGEHIWMSLVVQISTIVISILYIKAKKYEKIFIGFISLILPFSVLILITTLFAKNLKIGWIYILMPSILYFMTVFLYNKRQNYLLIGLLFTLPFITSIYILPNIVTLSLNQNKIKGQQFPNIEFVNENKKQITINSNKIVLLEFWNSKCGICFKKFPDLEKLYLKYKRNKNVQIFSVNILLPSDNFEKVSQLVKDYDFPIIYAVSENEIFSKLNFNYVPYCIIIKNNKIRYAGVFRIDNDRIVGNTENEIEKLLNE